MCKTLSDIAHATGERHMEGEALIALIRHMRASQGHGDRQHVSFSEQAERDLFKYEQRLRSLQVAGMHAMHMSLSEWRHCFYCCLGGGTDHHRFPFLFRCSSGS